jgi:hypothetical protein
MRYILVLLPRRRRIRLPQIFGIWQGCQISRLFHEDAQGAQVIYLTILPR